MKKFFLFINTVKYLSFKQIYFRIIRKTTRLPEVRNKTYVFPKRSSDWFHQNLYSEKIDNKLKANFINFEKKLNLPSDWNTESVSKLWLYNLHYFEYLLSEGSEQKHDLHIKLIDSWIDNNKSFNVGWEPYPTSLRIVNILKAWLGGLELNKKIFDSIFEQAYYLLNNLEKDLLANHYFANLKALIFVGKIFKDSKLIKLAEMSLLKQIEEQILLDGAHCELSPMYHSIILVDMLDILNLLIAFPSDESKELKTLLRKRILKMVSFMDSMMHPDGGISFFNDSVNGIAPINKKIEFYSRNLGFKINNTQTSQIKVIDNIHSGYICAYAGESKLIFDASPIGYKYNPGHAHADTLSFELSIGSQRVFVNSGTSEYENSKRRILERKTISHNTVEVDQKDSSQIWDTFRVAERANVTKRSIFYDNQIIRLSASHNGYKTLIGGCIVNRDLEFSSNQLTIIDSIDGSYNKAFSRLHIHPDIKVKQNEDNVSLETDDFYAICNLKDKCFKISNSKYSPEFNVLLSNKVLEVEILNNQLQLQFDFYSK